MIKFVASDDFLEGNPSIIMTYSGFDLPIVDEHPELAVFNVFTFAIFRKQRSIDMCYGPVNQILENIPLNKQKIIAQTFVLCNAYIKDDENIDPEKCVEYCAKIINAMEQETNICQDIDKYTRENVYMPDMSDAGTHPQDREDLTFCREEAIINAALFIFMKMFNPVIGQFIHKYGVLLGNKYKERMASSMFTPIYRRHYQSLIVKLIHYTERLVYNKLKDDANIHYTGYTVASIALLAADTLFVKKSASIDLNRKDSFIIRFEASCIKSFVESLQKSSKKTSNVKIFDNPKDSDTSSIVEESNSSRIETESRPSKKPVDTVALAHNAAKTVISETVNEFNLDRDNVVSTFMWYRDNPVVTTILSTYILACYYGGKINGKNILLLNNVSTVKLAAILQIIAMKDGCPNIAHALTLSTSLGERVSTQADFAFMNAWKSSPEYIACKKTITSSLGLLSWDTQLKNIAAQLTQKNFIYHTAPQIYDINGSANLNGKVFGDIYGLMIELLVFTLKMWNLNSYQGD